MNGPSAGGDQMIGPQLRQETMMGNAMVNALIAAGIVFAIGYGWITHLQNLSLIHI